MSRSQHFHNYILGKLPIARQGDPQLKGWRGLLFRRPNGQKTLRLRSGHFLRLRAGGKYLFGVG
jgi:hypothetical protein